MFVRMWLPEPVEYLDDPSYLEEVRELHDPEVDLMQYERQEPQLMEHLLGALPWDRCETIDLVDEVDGKELNRGTV